MSFRIAESICIYFDIGLWGAISIVASYSHYDTQNGTVVENVRIGRYFNSLTSRTPKEGNALVKYYKSSNEGRVYILVGDNSVYKNYGVEVGLYAYYQCSNFTLTAAPDVSELTEF